MHDPREGTPSQTSLPDVQPNFGYGLLRVFLWLMPSGIAVACLFLTLWIEDSNRLDDVLHTFPIPIGIAGLLACAWFDSRLALPCRTGKRSSVLHVVLFILAEVILVIPAVFFATAYTICALAV